MPSEVFHATCLHVWMFFGSELLLTYSHRLLHILIAFTDSSVILIVIYAKGRPGAVVRAVSLSHQVVGSKQPLRRFCGGRLSLGFSLPQTPLMWEPPALGLPPLSYE